MKTIQMQELKEGDVFTHELKLAGREAFVVTKVDVKSVYCKSRNSTTGNEIKKSKKGAVIWLRNLFES